MAVKRRNVSQQPSVLEAQESSQQHQKGVGFLCFCILGIYCSFLTWGVLQERISTTPYGPDQRVFRASNAINVLQSSFAFITGCLFLKFNNPAGTNPKIVPSSMQVVKWYAIVALCQTFSSPLSFAALKHVDYITVTLAKSCKLVPVMIVHLLLYRTKFPGYKYVVVAAVTLGVSIFSLCQPQKPNKTKSLELAGQDQTWGFVLLLGSLFLDGLYNTTQDRMFQKFKTSSEVSGPHMMVILNFLTATFSFVGLFVSAQLEETVWFLRNHPVVFRDIALYGVCGAIGQVFIFLTLERFGSLVLVTTTVTRKMMSMLLSVVMFNHKLTQMQWFGVALVFGGVTGETVYKQLQKKK